MSLVDSQSFLLPSDILNSKTPSEVDGIDHETEVLHRIFGCEIIQEAGIRMELRQVAVVTGQNLLHRFFYRKSLKRFDSFSVAMACLCLASKLEEQPKLLREFIFTFHNIYLIRKGIKPYELDIGTLEYADWKDELINAERYILKDLGFCFHQITNHPHKFILYFVKLLNGDSKLAQTAWNYLNDGCRLDLALRFEPQIIACSAICMAMEDINYPALSTSEPWWTLITEDYNQILTICKKVRSLYDHPPITWIDPIVWPPYLSTEYNRNLKVKSHQEFETHGDVHLIFQSKAKQEHFNAINNTHQTTQQMSEDTEIKKSKSWRERAAVIRNREGSNDRMDHNRSRSNERQSRTNQRSDSSHDNYSNNRRKRSRSNSRGRDKRRR